VRRRFITDVLLRSGYRKGKPGINFKESLFVKRLITSLSGLVLALGAFPSLASPSAPARAPEQARAVVLVSGGAIRTPFTTPTQACKDGDGFLAAGNTYTALRKYLLDKGKRVFTAPAMDNWGIVKDPPRDTVGPFTDCPTQLPESMTIMSTGDWNAGGERLVRFLGHLHTQFGITDVDLVGHSNGSGRRIRRSRCVPSSPSRHPIRVRLRPASMPGRLISRLAWAMPFASNRSKGG
jgi:pimeloyl-ACP methyl ester carboxylesterase